MEKNAVIFLRTQNNQRCKQGDYQNIHNSVLHDLRESGVSNRVECWKQHEQSIVAVFFVSSRTEELGFASKDVTKLIPPHSALPLE